MAEETFKLVEKLSEAPTFVQNIEQRGQEAPEEFTYAGPIKPPGVLDYLKEPAAWFKSGMGGLASGVSGVAKTINLIPGVESITEPVISKLDESAKWWEPKEDAPGRVSNWVRSAFTSSGQSVSAGFAGGVAALALGPGIAAVGGAGIAAATLGAILSKGLTFGGAQYYDLTKDIEKEFKARGATPEELAIIQKENAAWKTASAVAEVGGEWASDFISARIFGLVGNPAIRAPIKAGIMAAFGRFAKKMGWAQVAEIAGEEMTTAVQYKAAEAITLPQSDYWKQFEDTMAITGIQTLMMGAGASAVASTRTRSNEAFLQDLKAKASAALQEKGVNKDTADTIADSIIKRAGKVDAADNAIAELEARAEARKATKEERVVKKGEQKKTAAEKSKEIIEKILAPEVPTVEGLIYNGVQKVPGIPDQYVFTEEKTHSTFYTKDLSVENLIAERDKMQTKFAAAETEISLEGMGQAISDNLYKSMWDRLQKTGRASPFEKSPLFESKIEELYREGKIKSVEDIRNLSKPVKEPTTAREEKLAKLRGETLTYRVTPTIETAIRQPTEIRHKYMTEEEFNTEYGGFPDYPFINLETPRGARNQIEFIKSVTSDKETMDKVNKVLALMDEGIYSYKDYIKSMYRPVKQIAEVALPKQETTFIRLEPSENPEVPDVIVTDQSGRPAIFNPDIHILTNQPEARRAIEAWTPTAKVETTRERRLRILTEAGRIAPEQPVQVPVVGEEVKDTSTATEVVAIMKKLRPGFVEHVSAMSKRGWTIDDFINDPDVRADLEGVVSEAKYYDLIMDVKEEIGAMTSTDIFDRQVRDEQRTLNKDFAEIDKMKNEDLMQKESTEDDEYYDVEHHKWVQLEKEETVDNIERQFVEPSPTVEKVPVVVQVPDRKIFSKKVTDNTVWFQPKEEALTQLDLLKQVKLSWDSDVDTMLHALSTQTNVAYHTDSRVPFDALSKLSSNLDYFKKNLSHSEYSRLVNSLDSLRAFMVDISDALKSTDEQVQGTPPKIADLEKYNAKVRGALGLLLLDMITPTTNASSLIDFIFKYKDSFSAPIVALAQHFNSTHIRNVLDSVGVVVPKKGEDVETISSAFYAGLSSRLAQEQGRPVIGFSSNYDRHVGTHYTSVGEDILHEITHALTVEVMKTSKSLRDSVTDLRLKAIDNLGENDRRILLSLRGNARKFYEVPFDAFGLSRSQDYLDIYYGLTNNNEFIANVFTSPKMQEYLSGVPIEGVKEDSKVRTLWDRFKEILLLAIFNRPIAERESTLLDAALKVGHEAIEMQSQLTYEDIAYEAKERSVNASTPRIKSIAVEEALQRTPLKGSGIHAGLGTPIQQTVNIVERPIDITELATYIESPLFALRDHPDALQFAGEAIDAVGTWAYNRSLGFMEIDRITRDLSEKEREKVTSILKEIESGEVINLDILDPKIKGAVIDTRKLLDTYKEKHKKFLRESLILGANSTEARIFADVLIGGESVLDATKKWNRFARDNNKDSNKAKIATTTYVDMLSLFKEWKEIESFGIKDYITHAMRGSIALIDSEGNIISFAQTKSKAVNEALQYLKHNPSVESIEVDTTYRLDKDFQTLVSQKYYRTMKGKIARLVNQYAKEIGKDLTEKLKAELPGRGIAIKPQKIWSQFLQEREEVLPGEKDVFDILPLYVHSIEKKHAVDPYILKLRDHLHEFSDRPKVKKMLEEQLQAIRGEYSVGDAIVDDILAKFGFEQSFTYTRGLAATRTLLTNLKLGYRPVASLINLMSGMGHIWVKTSAKYMIEAQRMLGTEGGKEFIKKNAPSLGVSIVEGMGGDLESRLKWYSPLKMFQAPELPNRELSFMTSYLYARDQFGHDETEAVEFAKRSVDLQEFNYSIAALPKILRGPTGKTVGQFKAYLIKEIEFIRGLKGANQWAKYLTMQAVLGGPRGIMITLKSLPVLATIAGGGGWLDDLDTWLNNNYPRLSRGVFGFFGIDASAPASFQFPEKAIDWAGILISDIVRFGKDVVQPIANGESYLWEDIKKFGKGTVPIWRVWDEAWQGIMNEDGWVLDEQGNNKYKVEDWTELVRMAGGFKLLKSSVQELEMRMSKVLEDREKAQADKIVEQIVKRSRMIDVDIVTEEIVNEVAAHAISPDTIIAAIERSHLDPATRQLLKARMARRMDLWQRQLPLREFRGY